MRTELRLFTASSNKVMERLPLLSLGIMIRTHIITINNIDI